MQFVFSKTICEQGCQDKYDGQDIILPQFCQIKHGAGSATGSIHVGWSCLLEIYSGCSDEDTGGPLLTLFFETLEK